MDNTQLFFLIHNLNNRYSYIDQLMVFGAVTLIFVSFVLALALLFAGKTREKKAAFLVVLGVIIMQLLAGGIHLVYFEPRPFITHNFIPMISQIADTAFPSLHTAAMATLAGSLILTKSKYVLLFIILMLWVGIARIFVGVHYPLDIAAGIVLGFLSAYLAGLAVNYLHSFSSTG